MSYLTNAKLPLIGASDASLKEDQCSHAWILSTGDINHIEDPYMSLRGAGPVDCIPSDLLSVRGELHGQMALTIMSKTLLISTDCIQHPVKLIGDNKGIQEKTAQCTHNRLKHHCAANIDLYLEYEAAAKPLQRTVEWVRSHQDRETPWETVDDLGKLKLSSVATLNVWCNKQADKARIMSSTLPDPVVYPAEKWAL
jgi:hypothetical protein